MFMNDETRDCLITSRGQWIMQPTTKPNIATVKVERVDVGMLRDQRDALVAAIELREIEDMTPYGDGETLQWFQKQTECLDGLVNLLDHMIDTAEGFNV
tara:strand:+ start:88 stop:384 length:297 start_codon:yes stop_codon:yes gene_type:complete